MLYERIHKGFQPSGTTVASCLFVRKNTFDVSGIKHPGLHGYGGVPWDVAAILIVLIAELIGMLMLLSLFEASNYPASQLLIGAAVLVVVDVVLACFHHWFKAGMVTKLRAQILAKSTDESIQSMTERANMEGTIRLRLGFATLFGAMIVIFAVIKFMVYVSLAQTVYGSSLPGQYIALAFVLYSVTAVLHIKSTGYFIAWFLCSLLYRRDIKKFQKSHGTQCSATSPMEPLPDHPELGLLPKTDYHCVELNTAPTNPAQPYLLKASGLLLDKEIEGFLNQLTDEEVKRKFVLKALALQLRYLPA